MSLPALEDINSHRLAEAGSEEPIEGLIRIETTSKEQATPIIMEQIRSVYPHDQVFGEYCTVNDYIDCPPDELFDYLADTRSLEEWTYSLRDFVPTEEPGLWMAHDKLGAGNEKQTGSPIFTRTVANREARTVDYHCAWDQGTHLWMIYLMRVVDAKVVFDKPGSVVLWTNCRHPFYETSTHHRAKDATPIERIERAAAGLIARHGEDVISGVDVLITHTQVPDIPFYGGGGGRGHRVGRGADGGAA